MSGTERAPKPSLKSLLVVLRYSRRYVKPLAVTILATVGLVCVQLTVPWLVKLLLMGVRRSVEGQGGLDFATTLAVGLLAIYLMRGLLQFLRSYMSHLAGWGAVADARQALYEHLQKLSLRFYEDQQTGQLMSRMVNDTDKFENLISHALPDTLVNVLSLAGVTTFLMILSWRLALLTVIPIPLVFLAARSFARYVRPAFRQRQQVLAELNATLQDNLSGMREIKAFGREDDEADRVGEKIQSFKGSSLRALRLMATFSPFVEFASSLGMVIVIWFGGRLAGSGALAIEDLVAFMLYLEIFYQPVRALSGAWEQFQEGQIGAERVGALLDEQPDVRDRPGAAALPGRAEGAILFRGVGFRYSRGDNVLEGIDVDIPARSVVALVGPSGVGKTTFASLIPRFYDVTSGSITLDGRDVRDVSLRSLRDQISIVLQDVFLFQGTVRENILFGRKGAAEEDVKEASRIANASEFIETLPDGYDTVIGERGIKLSGGQKQRIAIARAVLKDAPVLILDEATSSVDTQTEILIKQALDRLMEGKTTLIIAHRLSTIRNADMILVLENKGLREAGTHEELMRLGGLYHRLTTVQAMHS